MGGGKKSKHKNLYKGQRKPDTGVNACGKVPKTLDYADFEKGCTANQASFENANVTVKSEVTYVADSDEELMETTKCDEKDITEADSFEVKKDDENLSVTMEDTKKIKSNPDGGDRGKGKKQTHYRDFSPKVHSEPNQYSHPNKNNRSCGGRNDRKDNEYQTKSYGNQNDRHDRKSRQSDNVSYSDCKQLDKTENFKKERMDTSQWDDDDATFSIEITEDSESSSVVENEEKKAKDDTEKEHFKDDSDKRRDPGRKQRWGKVGEPPTVEETKNKWDFYSNPHQESNRSQQFSGSAQSTHYRNKSGDRKNYQGDDTRSYGRGYGEGKSGRYRADSFGSKDRGSTSRSKDLDYVHWNKNLRYSPKEEGTNVNERFGDLFCASDEYSLAHCVAEDMNMGSGIATTFRSVFKRVYELLQQRVTQGGVAVLHVDGRYIYYLVTKRQSSGKPTYERLFRSLCAMRKHIEENDVTKLAMPRIGCGLDGLEWREVKSMLQYIFYGVNVDIVIYNFQQESASTTPLYPKKKCPVKNVLKRVVDIEEYTIILYPCSVERYISNEMRELDKKFNIIRPYEFAKRTLGSVIRTEYRQQLYLIYGVVVQETPDDLLNYQYFQKCIAEINRLNKKEKYEYVAMQGFEEKRDTLIVSKLVNLMRNTFFNVYVYICWPKELEHLAPRDIDYS